MPKIMEQGVNFSVHADKAFVIHETLPVGTYSVHHDEQNDIYSLVLIEDFVLPSKIYGDTEKNADRILNTMQCRDVSTGVHLDGEKGSGKTLLAKMLSVRGRARGCPTVVVNQPHAGETFNKFIQNIGDNVIILFDEFEKTYPQEIQNRILTLFDGVYKTQKLFIITTNQSWLVSDFMKNRPGRMYYSLEFENLEPEFVREYCEDNLKDQKQVESVVSFATIFNTFNFDMLAAAIEEMNRYDETLMEVMKYLNVTAATANYDSYKATLIVDGFGTLLEAEYEPSDVTQLDFYVKTADIQKLIMKATNPKAAAAAEEASRKSTPAPNVATPNADEDIRPDDWVTSQPIVWDRSGLTAGTKQSHYLFTGADLAGFDKKTKTYIFRQDIMGKDVVLQLERNALKSFDTKRIIEESIIGAA